VSIPSQISINEKFFYKLWFEILVQKWKNEATYDNVKKIGLQQDFIFGTGSGCQAGYCTD
jgi:hypothetical protein